MQLTVLLLGYPIIVGIGETPLAEQLKRQAKFSKKRPRKPLPLQIFSTPITARSEQSEPMEQGSSIYAHIVRHLQKEIGTCLGTGVRQLMVYYRGG